MSAWDTATRDDSPAAPEVLGRFKRDGVDLVLTTGRPIAMLDVELGIYDSTRGKWVRRH